MSNNYKDIHAEIIERSILGDRYAQNQLYKLYSKAMFNVSLRITNNRDDAEDALQEAFVSAFRNLGSWKGDASFGAWLKRIVINKSINLIKSRKPLESEIADVEAECDQPETELAGSMLTVDKIKGAIEQLPDGYRMVFSLYLLEGYDHGEIGGILGITESTSKSQFNRAKKKIKEILQKEVIYE